MRRAAQTGGAEVRERPIWPGSASTTRYAEPLAAIRAARVLEDAARRVARDNVRYARQDGATWQQVGEALGLAADGEQDGYDLAVAAYEHAAGPSDAWHQSSFSWGCTACGSAIADRGPYESHPDDNERGHADTCRRHAAAVAAWQAERDAWEAGK